MKISLHKCLLLYCCSKIRRVEAAFWRELSTKDEINSKRCEANNLYESSQLSMLTAYFTTFIMAHDTVNDLWNLQCRIWLHGKLLGKLFIKKVVGNILEGNSVDWTFIEFWKWIINLNVEHFWCSHSSLTRNYWVRFEQFISSSNHEFVLENKVLDLGWILRFY